MAYLSISYVRKGMLVSKMIWLILMSFNFLYINDHNYCYNCELSLSIVFNGLRIAK